LSSCDAVKRVAENELLLTDNTVEIDGEEVSDNILESLIIQKPNSKLAGIPLALHFYNLANDHTAEYYYEKMYRKPGRKERLAAIYSQKQVDEMVNYRVGINNWIKNNGEAPVIIRKDRAQKTTERLEEYYKSLGWFNARAKYQIVKDTTQEKRGSVVYSVERQKAYIIDSIQYFIESPVVDSIFQRIKRNTLIKEGEQYNRNNFANEIVRVTNRMRNSGLYNFDQEYISFIGDTVQTGHKAIIEYYISNRTRQVGDSVVSIPFQIHTISKVNIVTDHNYQNSLLEQYQDSTYYNGYYVYSYGKQMFKPKAIVDAVFIEPGRIYRDWDRSLTYNHLNGLGVFKYPNISYELDPADSTQTSLIANILLSPKEKFGATIDFDVSTSTIQQYGVGFNGSFVVRNAFRRAETLEFSLRGSVGSSKDAAENESNFFNISEIGGDIRLKIPRMFFPFRTDSIIPKRMSPYTNISVGGSNQHNIGLDKQTISTILNYQWTPNRQNNYSLDLIHVQFVRNLNTDNYFNVYKNSFNRLNEVALDNYGVINPDYFVYDDLNNPIRLQIPEGANNFLRDLSQNLISLPTKEEAQLVRNIDHQKKRLTEDNLILASNITWTKSTRRGLLDNSFSRTRIKFEAAGNLLYAAAPLLGLEKNDNGSYNWAGVRFSQYSKLDVEFVKYWQTSRNSVVAMRLFGGLAVPYGNSSSIPFTRSYFAGGPNDNRGWLPYKLGPGTSKLGNEFNEANLKLAGNAEYRFTIIGAVKGALFTDVGNIWNAFDDSTDPNAVFDEVSDFEGLAVASGFGLRYDLGFFVIRADLGFKTYNPALDEGSRWFKQFNFKHSVFNIAINYPF
jgi:hypothetical protein